MTNVHNRNVSLEECDCHKLKRTNARAGECQNKIGRKLDLLSGKINPVFQSTIHDNLALILENVLSEINLSKSISSCELCRRCFLYHFECLVSINIEIQGSSAFTTNRKQIARICYQLPLLKFAPAVIISIFLYGKTNWNLAAFV
ncbi:unnamed protein product [Hermetia illucens]|uniref:Uncharacterized protein n=1 Tax=Hermetia illucens TaxID=343691 RepID=A0A7R8YVH9_HERIL|nr:unnamed protein product [Hermetia illucens]